MRFVTYSSVYNKTPAARARKKFFQENFCNDDERLTYLIQERMNHYSRKYDLLKYEPWLHHPQTCAMKFEELYLEFMQIEKNGFGPLFNQLFCYLDIDIKSLDPVSFYKNTHENSLTASGKKTKISQYKYYFKEEHYELLDNDNFNNILNAFGYK
jgi:hypothetical protein